MIKQSYTVAAASLTGFASNVTGDTFTLTANTAGDGLAHFVTIKNDSATDHSGKTITLTGASAENEAITETLAAPGTSATVTSTKAFLYLGEVTVSATIGADTFDIGWTAAAQSPWVVVRYFPVTAAVVVGGTINFDIQHGYKEPGEAFSNIAAFNSEAGKTANQDHNYTSPVSVVRVDVNSHTSGTFTIYLGESNVYR